MDETKRAWDEVGEGFAQMGRLISERYHRLGQERGSQTPPADEGALADAVRKATDELDRAFTSLGETLRDEQAQEHVRATGRKLADALKITFSELGEEIRRATGTYKTSSPGKSPPPPPPT